MVCALYAVTKFLTGFIVIPATTTMTAKFAMNAKIIAIPLLAFTTDTANIFTSAIFASANGIADVMTAMNITTSTTLL